MAGEQSAAQAREHWQQSGVDAEVVGFCHDMPRVYAAADVVVCRAGASSCAELALAGLGSILIPLPSAAEDHQTVNAQALVQRGAACLVPEPASATELAEALRHCWPNLRRSHGVCRRWASRLVLWLSRTLLVRPGVSLRRLPLVQSARQNPCSLGLRHRDESWFSWQTCPFIGHWWLWHERFGAIVAGCWGGGQRL